MYCSKCGKEIKKQSIFCMYCGNKILKKNDDQNKNEQLDLKRNKRKAKILIPIIISVVVFMLFWGNEYIWKTSYSEPAIECNYNNTARLAYDDTRIYFIGKYKEFDENTYLYSTTYSGTDRKPLIDGSNIVRMRLINDQIYYLEVEEEFYIISCINKDGSGDREILRLEQSGEGGFFEFDLKGDALYYLNNDELHKYDMKKGTNICLGKTVDEFTIAGNYIYYAQNGLIYSYNLRNKKHIEICKANVNSGLVYDSGKLYYTTGSGIYYSDLENNGVTTRLVATDAAKFTIVDDTLYYIDILSEEEEKFFVDYMYEEYDDDSFNMSMLLIEVGMLYKIPKIGGESEAVSSNAPLLFDIYYSPAGFYYRLSPFSNTVEKLEIN